MEPRLNNVINSDTDIQAYRNEQKQERSDNVM